jgi:hypothetical protein
LEISEMAYTIADTFLGYPKINATSTAPWTGGGSTLPPLGTIVRAVDSTLGAGEFIFLKGVASTAIGSWVTYNEDDFSTTLLAANAIGPVAIAMAANVASQYGWYQIQGKASGLALASFADNANVYATATAGSVDDAVVAGDRVKGAVGASTIVGAGLAEFEIARPFMDDAVAA